MRTRPKCECPRSLDNVHSSECAFWRDPVKKPSHYVEHPSGVECVQITEHMTFCLGNATKYIWRAGLKTENPVEDLRKAIWYLEREIDRLQRS